MRVLVCVKRVPSPGAKIVLTDGGTAIDTAHLGFTVSPHEECAVEEAVQIVEREGGSATVLTLGPDEAEEQLRQAVSVGADAAVLVAAGTTEHDPQSTAAALTDAIGALEAEEGTFDLILFGNESADSGGYQVGVRVAHALGRPVVGGVKGIGFEGDEVVARRPTDEGLELYRLPRPAVLAVKEGINLPRYPTLKGRLASRKAEIRRLDADVAAGPQRLVRMVNPPEQVKGTEMLGEGAAAAPRVVELLVELGLV